MSGGDVPAVESIDAQISDYDPESRTWGKRTVSVPTVIIYDEKDALRQSS